MTADEVRAGSGGTSEGLQVLGGCEGQDEGGLELKRGHRENLFTNGVFPSCIPQTTVSHSNIFIFHINIKLCCSYFTNLSLFSSKQWVVENYDAPFFFFGGIMVLYIRKTWGFEVDTLSLSLESNGD